MVCECLFVFSSYASWIPASKSGWRIYLFLNGCSHGLSKLGMNLFVSFIYFRPKPDPRFICKNKINKINNIIN
jgi:hypothetical protein